MSIRAIEIDATSCGAYSLCNHNCVLTMSDKKVFQGRMDAYGIIKILNKLNYPGDLPVLESYRHFLKYMNFEERELFFRRISQEKSNTPTFFFKNEFRPDKMIDYTHKIPQITYLKHHHRKSTQNTIRQVESKSIKVCGNEYTSRYNCKKNVLFSKMTLFGENNKYVDFKDVDSVTLKVMTERRKYTIINYNCKGFVENEQIIPFQVIPLMNENIILHVKVISDVIIKRIFYEMIECLNEEEIRRFTETKQQIFTSTHETVYVGELENRIDLTMVGYYKDIRLIVKNKESNKIVDNIEDVITNVTFYLGDEGFVCEDAPSVIYKKEHAVVLHYFFTKHDYSPCGKAVKETDRVYLDFKDVANNENYELTIIATKMCVSTIYTML